MPTPATGLEESNQQEEERRNIIQQNDIIEETTLIAPAQPQPVQDICQIGQEESVQMQAISASIPPDR